MVENNSESRWDRDSFLESTTQIAKAVVPILIGGWLLRGAYAGDIKREVLTENNLTCQSPLCVGLIFDEVNAPRSMLQEADNPGWMITVAHPSHRHGPPRDRNKEGATLLCVCCHIIDEYMRGNARGARLLHKNLTMRSERWLYQNPSESDFDIGLRELQQIANERLGYNRW